jgi:hypothetical protein
MKQHSEPIIDWMESEDDQIDENFRYTDGYCPQCELKGEKVPMVANSDDFWECPKCHLQAHSGCIGMFAILQQRGQGKLKGAEATSSRLVIGSVITEGTFDGVPKASPRGFNSKEDLQKYLQSIPLT